MPTRPDSQDASACPGAPIALHCHPACRAGAVSAIAVEVRRGADGALRLAYRLHGDPAGLRIPAPATPGPVDGLWQHTCLEAFVAAVDAENYHEFNFSPAGHWASYRFTACRERDSDFVPGAVPTIDFQPLSAGFELRATIPAALLPPGTSLQLGLTAVIEAADGSKSYWALAHCAAQPDFHLRQSFTLTLPRNAP